MACEKHKLNPVKGYSDCPGCEIEWLRDRAAKAESLAKRLADDALTALAGIVCTPVEGYLLAPQCLAADIRNLRKLEEAATKRAVSAEKGWQESNDMLFSVTAVCNGSSAMEHLDQFRAADAMLQEENNHRMRALIAEASDYLDTNNLTNIMHGSILHRKFKDELAESV